MQHSGSQFPNQGSNPRPLQWKHGILTTGPPRKSQRARAFKVTYHSWRGACPSGRVVLVRSLQLLYPPPSHGVLSGVEAPRIAHAWGGGGILYFHLLNLAALSVAPGTCSVLHSYRRLVAATADSIESKHAGCPNTGRSPTTPTTVHLTFSFK